MINIIDDFIIELNSIIKIKSIDDILDYIFECFDELLFIDNNSNLANEILKNIEVNKYDIDILIGFLTSIYPYKNKLDYYNIFYKKIKKYLSMTYGKDEIKNILWGLKD